MILPINDEYRVTTDKLNFILERKSTKKDDRESVDGDESAEKGWSRNGYYPSLKSAVQSLHERNIRMDDAVGVQAVLDAIERSKNEITAALEVRKEQLSLI